MVDLPTIEREALEKELRDDGPIPPILVEALSTRAYEDVHLPGAINIPPDRVRELAPALLPDKDAAIVVYCSSRSCRNSTLVAAQLLKLGYRNVRDYEGGKQDWIEAGLPTEGGAAQRGEAGAR